MDQIQLIKAYTILKSLKANLPEDYSIKVKYVMQYHDTLSQIEDSTGENLSLYRVPDTEMENHFASPEDEGYKEHSYCDRPVLMIKLDAVLGFFEILSSNQPAPEKPKIGFRVS